MALKFDRRLTLALLAIVTTASAGWLLIPTFAKSESKLASNAAPVVGSPVPRDVQALAVAPQPLTASTPLISVPDAAELQRISLLRQSFKRGGLGSKALMSFTVRNANDYPVKDLEILCAFRSSDGHYTTERRRLIADTVDTNSRKAFPLTHLGFVNIKAAKASCGVVTASRA